MPKNSTNPNFNPPGSDTILEIKNRTDDLLAYIEANVPDNYRKEEALKQFEQAAMWAVKANF